MLSRINVLRGNKLFESIGGMKKLNQRKIRWIVREMKKGELTVCRIARQHKITPRHARRVFEKYKDDKKPKLLPCGRKPRPVTQEEVKTILRTRKEHPFGAVNLQAILDEKGMHIPHNHIHKVLKQEKLAINEPKKQKRRKWIRYEREHSNSLWHIDYCAFDGKQVLGLIDDASRLVVGYGEFDNATAENAVKVLDKAVQKYPAPTQLLSDNGSHFTSVIRESCSNPENNIFQKRLNQLGIEHIKTRINHPQTNGKLERWFGTLKQLKKHFHTTRRVVYYYNNKRPHMSLNNSKLITPAKAYKEKLKGNKSS